MNTNVNIDVSNVVGCLFPMAIEYKINSTPKDRKFLKQIAKNIQIWTEENIAMKLKEDMLSYFASKRDICALYLSKNTINQSFIVIMEDSTSDTVFEYNEFGFKLSEKYQEIKDFMIIDSGEAEGCSGLLKNYSTIYKRGELCLVQKNI